MRKSRNNRIHLAHRLSEHIISQTETNCSKVGVGITSGNDTSSLTSNGESIIGGRFTVLWCERRGNERQVKNNNKFMKYIKRKTVKLVSGRDLADQVFEGITQATGHLRKIG